MREPGCSTWCFFDRSLTGAIEELSSRTNTIEIFADAAHDILCRKPLPVPDEGIFLSVHAPTADINLASCRETVRNASVEIIAGVCQKAAEMGASHVVVHPGFCPWREQEKESFSALLRSLDDLVRIQEQTGMTVAVENMGSWEMCHFRDPGLLPELSGRGLSFCLDVGHAFLNGVLDDFLSRGSPCAVHIHDNRGRNDDHLPPGMGNIDFTRVFWQLSREIPWILEIADRADVDRGLLTLANLGTSDGQGKSDIADDPCHPDIHRRRGEDVSLPLRMYKQK
ncbi:MAG: sugar phosphate isomerase/epimerase family protein [Methanolinea sp.]|jgi:sugar phosphate isomerase/epimerase|nr:sugar phosphate isomerase/epimerase family protein [Methanolinea sp.]